MNESLDYELVLATADIVSALVSNNAVHASDLPSVIAEVHAGLRIVAEAKTEAAAPAALTPAIPVKKSVTDDYLVCLDDGKRFKSLKRHLAILGMTPGEYRVKWGLPRDYPMVAPGYAAKRSELAKAIGLGASRRKIKAEVAPEPTNDAAPARAAAKRAKVADEGAAEQVAEAPSKRRGRPAKKAA